MISILTDIPRDQHVIYIDRVDQRLCVLIYEEVEQRSELTAAHTALLRESLLQKGFRRGTRVQHRTGNLREIEQWTAPVHGSNAGILLFVPALCRVHLCRYVSLDPHDRLLYDCPESVLKIDDKHYQLITRERKAA